MLVERMPCTRSYLVDRPGFGLSDPDKFRPGHPPLFAVGWVGDVSDALASNVVLVGASGGGIWATWYALATRSGSAGW